MKRDLVGIGHNLPRPTEIAKHLSRFALVLRELSLIARRSGPKVAFRKAIQRIYNVHESLLLAKEGPFPHTKLPPEVSIRIVGIDKRDELMDSGAGSDVLNFERGATCYVARVKDEFAGIGWRFHESRLLRRLKLDRSGIYLGGFIVQKQFRGRGIYPLLLETICSESLDSTQIAFAEVDGQNYSSIRGLTKAGFIPKGRLRVTSIAGSIVGCKLTDY